MSRIGKLPIKIPENVDIKLEKNRVAIKGPKGELNSPTFPHIDIEVKDNEIVITRNSENDKVKALHGLTRALLANAVRGVTQGYERRLELVGTGYRVKKEGSHLILNLGYSHPIVVEAKSGIEFEVEGEKEIIIRGIDKEQVGQMAARIRALRKPEPYKGKGVKYKEEVVRRKPGKVAKVGAAQLGGT